MSSQEIKKRQNEALLLKIQYAARCHYNKAEIINYFVWILCLISGFSVFLPETTPIFISSIPFFSSLGAFSLMILVNNNVHKGAELRKYFDSYVLGIGGDNFSEDDKRRLFELAEKTFSKNPEEATRIMNNTGSDNPPGVYDWYSFSNDYTGLDAIFECQRQNTWWDKELSDKKKVIAVILFFPFAALFIYFMVVNGIIHTILCSSGLLIKLIERIIENKKYYNKSREIYGAQKTLIKHLSIEGISSLQDMINDRRAINVLGINLLHKKLSKTFTELYQKITNPR